MGNKMNWTKYFEVKVIYYDDSIQVPNCFLLLFFTMEIFLINPDFGSHVDYIQI
jgi:hypothetical protein